MKSRIVWTHTRPVSETFRSSKADRSPEARDQAPQAFGGGQTRATETKRYADQAKAQGTATARTR